jgi:anaerobic dimethyl sulfoxide reductase subunit B
MQLGFFFDQNRCTGCLTCVIACKDWHDIPAGPLSWMKVSTLEKGEFPKVSVTQMIRPCYHCAEPSCMEACGHGAILKRDSDGIVLVDKALCIACKECADACPYGVPQFTEDGEPEMQKCDFCLDRWQEGKKPICVESCPTRALDAGPLEDLQKKYGNVREVEGFSYFKDLQPSVIFKSKK